MSILIVEDDQQIVSYLKKGLEEESFEVEIAINGEDGLALIRQKSYSLIILDWMLPKLSGIDLCTLARNNNVNTPILILSAKGDIQDKIEGLNSGADDYLSKPFSFDELVARVNALIRRRKLQKDTIYSCGDLKFNITKRVLSKDDNEIFLTTKEYESLDLLMQVYFHQEYFMKHNFIDASIKDIYIQDYLNKTKKDAKRSVYVFGSHVTGPHGDDLIPFKDRYSAKLFQLKYGGTKIMSFDKITIGLIRYLDM